ncbi:ATP-dependent Clp protease ATP-binding subunit [Patescibacteria group bacterium]|nr:MAG: ATP-dependent Clp protease ATP-binding subunit [Patescibacteria group bacterium]
MAVSSFKYSSPRAEKARIAVSLSRSRISLLVLCVAVFIIAGITAVVFGWSVGWVLIGFSAIPAMTIEWVGGELRDLKPVDEYSSIDDVLSGDVLGLLSRKPTPYEVATIVGQVYGGQFFAVRFGIGSGFLQEISSKDATDTPALWEEAMTIAKLTGSSKVSAAVLVVAIIKIYPKHEALLAHLQLTIDDVVAGVTWQNHIHDVIEQYKKPKRTGGIARDWSFGWIPTLSEFGQNISTNGSASSVELEAHKEALDQLVHVLSSNGRQNAALVGPSGVGKTEIVYTLAGKLLNGLSDVPANLKFRQIFLLDAAALISAAPGRGELESLVNQLLNEAYSAKNIIICLDNAELFFEEGLGSVDMTTVLLPILQNSDQQLILTMDEQRYLKVSERNGQLANALNRIAVAPASHDETIVVMQDHLMTVEYLQNVTYMYQALEEAYRLGARYIHDLAMPGRALKLLESAAGYSEQGLVTAFSVQQAIEKTMDIKITNAHSVDEREKLLHLEDLIHERMINQTHAVGVVSDALRRARAGVRNQNRPIGTFMFLGPTGVGKTELAKALADVYFGGEDRLVRLDMNEYVSNDDVTRLIADGADEPGSLTARLMKQPFSVVLLDEIEKAHPNVLTTLLQLLDEGILRDIRGREVSFRDAIIIATSNAGADRIREHIERGIDIEKFESQFIDELIESNLFKPEFLNRFDEIIMFRPLKKDELLQVVDLIIKDVNKTLELQKVSVTVSQDAKEYLVDAGYDPRLGARPMRRVVQRAVENTVAKQVLSGAVEAGGTVEIRLEQVEALVSSKKTADGIVNESTVE